MITIEKIVKDVMALRLRISREEAIDIILLLGVENIRLYRDTLTIPNLDHKFTVCNKLE